MGFLRGDEAGADPDALGAEGQRGCQSAAIDDGACGDHRDLHGIHDLGHKGHGCDPAGVAAGLGALGHDGVKTAVLAGLGVAHGAAHIHDLEACRMKAVDEVARGDAEARNEGRGPLLDDDVGRLLEGFGDGGQEVDAEGLLRQLADLAHLVADFLRAAACHAERSKAAGFGHGGADFGVGNTPHSREENRVFYAEHVTKGCAKGHGAFPEC